MPFILAGLACFICLGMIPVIISVSHAKGLLDMPGHRKVHKAVTPNLGGIAIFAAVTMGFLVSGYTDTVWAPYLLAGLVLLFFSGLKDDILLIAPLKKLFIQCVAIALCLFGGDIVIRDFGGVFGIGAVPYWLGMAITFFTMVVVLNAYNLIDGIDGLAGGIGLICSLFFGGWFYFVDMMPLAVLAFTLAGALVGFLWYNFHPASIFMGDTGSQIVGFLLAFFAISFVQTGLAGTGDVPFQNAIPVLVLAVLIVPLYDTLRVFSIRVFQGNSPFLADRRHLHHQLIDCGFSHWTSCLIIYSFNLIIIGITVALADINVNLLLGIVLLSAIILFPTVRVKRNILKKLGFEMPSSDHIQRLEKRIMIFPKSIEKMREQSQPSLKEEEKEKDKNEVMV